MTQRGQGKIIRWICKLTSSQKTSRQNGQSTEPGENSPIKSEYPPSPNNKGDKKTSSAQEWARTVIAGLALIVAGFAYSAAQQSASFAGRSADAAGRTADAAQRNVATAQAALQATIENNRLEQRAWVGVVGRIEQVVQVVSPIKVSIGLRNSGKTPALNVSPLIMPASLLSNQKFPVSPPYIAGTNPHGKFIIQPGAEVRVEVQGTILNQSDIDELKNGTRVGYFYGRISYEDIFHRPHCPTFCLRIDSSLTDVSFCETYNNETDNPCEG